MEQSAVGKLVDAIDLRFLERHSVMNHARRIATATEMPGKNMLFEYAGHVDSKVEQAVSEIGAKCTKLSSDVVDPMNKDHVEQVAGQLQQLKGSDLWVNLSFVERHKGKHQAHRKRVEDSLRHTLPLLQLCLDNHGRVAAEGPKKAHAWNHKLWKDFESANGLKRISFDGCMLGFEGGHYPKHCPLCVSTNSLKLIQYLSQHQCDGSHAHEHHKRAQDVCEDAYPMQLAKTIAEALFPSHAFKSVSHDEEPSLFSEAINIQSFLQYLLGYCCKTTYNQDNETLLTILASGYSAKLWHCGRVHRINIASMSEQIEDDLVVATYCPTKEQIANGLTKVINACEWPTMLVQLGLKLVPKEDKAMPSTRR